MSQFTFRALPPEHLPAVLTLQEAAFAQLGDQSEWLRRNTPQMLAACLAPPHTTIGAFAGDHLVAFIILYAGGLTEENLGLTLGMTDPAELGGVVNFKLVIVHPGFRGLSLMRQLMLHLEAAAIEERYNLIVSTVHPLNAASRMNMIRCGYQRVRTLPDKYGTGPRLVYVKNIEARP